MGKTRYSVRILQFCLAILTISTVGLAIFHACGVRFNTTVSMPRGIYQLDKGVPQKGDTVAFCLSDRQARFAHAQGYIQQGSCANGVQPLVKIIGGIEGDVIILNSNTVQIGNTILPTYGKDQLGRSLIQELQAGVIPQGQAFVYTPHERSYDSRYFGLVPRASLQKVRRIYP